MKTKSSLILILFSFAFVLYVYYFEYKLPLENELANKKVFSINAGSVRSITIDNDYDTITIDRHNKKWWLNRDKNVLADEYVLEEIIKVIEGGEHIEEIKELPKNPESTFGFDDNPVKITLEAEPINKVYISKKISFQGNYYLKRLINEDLRYFIVSPQWLSEFNKAPYYFRNKFLFIKDFSTFQAAKLVRNNNTVYRIYKNQENWIYEAGSEVADIEPYMVENFVNRLLQVKAVDILDDIEFGDEVLKKFQVDSSQYLELVTDKKKKVYYSLPKQERYYIFYRNKMFEVFKPSLKVLDWRLDDFLDRKKPFVLDIKSVERIQYYKKDKQLIDRKKMDGVWPSNKNFSFSHFAKNWLMLEVATYKYKKLPPHLEERLVLHTKTDDNLAVSWATIGRDKVLMTSSKTDQSFVISKKTWFNVLNAVKGEGSESN